MQATLAESANDRDTAHSAVMSSPPQAVSNREARPTSAQAARPVQRAAASAVLVMDTRELDIGVLLQAMGRCSAFYHQQDKEQFYALVAEEYSTMLPDRADVETDVLEATERVLRRLAQAIARTSQLDVDAEIPLDLRPHVRSLVAFYEGLDDLGESFPETVRGPTACVEQVRLVESAVDSVKPSSYDKSEEPEQSDESSSDPATPVVHEGGDDASASEQHVESAEVGIQYATESVQDLLIAVPAKAAFQDYTIRLTPHSVQKELLQLNRAVQEARDHMTRKSELVKAERERVTRAKNEYKTLKAVLKEYKEREREHKRVRKLIEGERDGSSHDGDRGSSSPRGDDKATRKERKRLKRLQSELSLRYQLLKSESERFEMKVEKELAELRREYADSYLFSGISLQE